MKPKTLEFFDTLTGDVPLAGFRQNGAICYSEGCLHYGRDTQCSDQKCEHVMRLRPSPAVPVEAAIQRISVSPDESRVILVGPSSLYVVLVPSELAPCESRENDGDELLCETLPVHPSLISKTKCKVLDERWLPHTSEWANHIAILFSDNKIRIYSLIADMDSPIAVFDFNQVLGSGDESFTNTGYGMHSGLVTFDFLRCASLVNPTILALTNEGQGFVGRLTSESRSKTDVYEVDVEGITEEPMAMISVPHEYDHIFDVLAVHITGSKNFIGHFVIIPEVDSPLQNDPDAKFNSVLTVPQEIIDLGKEPNLHLITFDRPNSYLISSSSRVTLVDLIPWLSLYSKALKGGDDIGAAPSKQYNLGTFEGNGDRIGNCVGQTAVVRCVKDIGEVTAFITRTSCPRFTTSFVQGDMDRTIPVSKVVDAFSTPKAETNFRDAEVLPILAKKQDCGKLQKSKSGSNVDDLAQFTKWAEAFSSNLAITNSAAQIVQKKLASFSAQVEANQRIHDDIQRRLVKVFEDFCTFKTMAMEKEQEFERLCNRLDAIPSRLSKKTTLSAQETKMLKKLREMRKETGMLRSKAAKITDEVDREKLLSSGVNVVVPPSTLHMRKIVQEVDSLRCRLDGVTESFANLQL